VRGTAPPHLLGGYHTERHQAGARILANTQAQVLLDDDGDRLRPLADLLTRVASHPDGNRAFAEIITALDTRYDMHPDTGHRWLGRLAPDLALTTEAGDTDVATLLSAGRTLLLDLAEDPAIRETAAEWAGHVTIAAATCPAHPELRGLLLRPDGHTAWLSTADQPNTDQPNTDQPNTDRHSADGLREALTHWHGPGATASSGPTDGGR